MITKVCRQADLFVGQPVDSLLASLALRNQLLLGFLQRFGGSQDDIHDILIFAGTNGVWRPLERPECGGFWYYGKKRRERELVNLYRRTAAMGMQPVPLPKPEHPYQESSS